MERVSEGEKYNLMAIVNNWISCKYKNKGKILSNKKNKSFNINISKKIKHFIRIGSIKCKKIRQ